MLETAVGAADSLSRGLPPPGGYSAILTDEFFNFAILFSNTLIFYRMWLSKYLLCFD
jgi:hypothetical protein